MANTEYSQVLPANTKILYIASRDSNSKLKIAYAPASIAYVTVSFGNYYYRENLDLVGKTVYFQSSKPGVIIEIEAWV